VPPLATFHHQTSTVQPLVSVGGVTQARAVVSQSSYYSHDDLRLHFGLGAATVADRVDVCWPGGSAQSVTSVRGDRVVTVSEPVPASR
jgi:hypothetical protein